jgi:hypothetical protein
VKEIHLVIVDNGPQCYMLYDRIKLGYQRVLNPEDIPNGAEIKIVNISISSVKEALFILKFTNEGVLLDQYIDYLQTLLKSTVLSIFPLERS